LTKLKHTFKTDILFKSLFVKYPELLKKLVSALLGIQLESIEKFEIRNPEMPPESWGEKFCRLDINMDVDGRRVDIEVQVEDEGDYAERSLFYWAREYSSALPAGGDYFDLPRTVIISILNYNMFDCNEFHSEFAALEVIRHTPLTDKFALHYFELPKLSGAVSAENSLELWLALFKANTEEELAKIEALGVPDMEQAIEAYRTVTVTPEFRELARLREKARHNEAAALRNARNKGIAAGEAKGRAEGKTEGVITVAKNALQMNMKIDDIVKMTGLSRKEVENLRNADR